MMLSRLLRAVHTRLPQHLMTVTTTTSDGHDKLDASEFNVYLKFDVDSATWLDNLTKDRLVQMYPDNVKTNQFVVHSASKTYSETHNLEENKQDCYDTLEQMIKLAKKPAQTPQSPPPGEESPEERKDRINHKQSES
jgi:hypothetical protein